MLPNLSATIRFSKYFYFLDDIPYRNTIFNSASPVHISLTRLFFLNLQIFHTNDATHFSIRQPFPPILLVAPPNLTISSLK
jgi:hypothetical protein